MLGTLLSTVRARLWALLHRTRLDRDLDDELAFHLAMREEAYREAGLEPEQARTAARRRFGNVFRLKEACRDVWTLRPLEQVAQDARYGFRQLRRNPGFAAVSIVTLSVAISANIAISGLLDAGLFRPLPVPDPDRLVLLHWSYREMGGVQAGASTPGCADLEVGLKQGCEVPYPVYEALRDALRSFAGLSVFASLEEVQVGFRGRSSFAPAQYVTGDYFSTLGVRASTGRLLSQSDDVGAGELVAVISDPYWRRHFGADPALLGQTVSVNGTALTIVGVTPPGFFGLDPEHKPSIWIPMRTSQQIEHVTGIGRHLLSDQALVLACFARLKTDTTQDAASLELQSVFQQLVSEGRGGVFAVDTGPGVALRQSGQIQAPHLEQ